MLTPHGLHGKHGLQSKPQYLRHTENVTTMEESPDRWGEATEATESRDGGKKMAACHGEEGKSNLGRHLQRGRHVRKYIVIRYASPSPTNMIDRMSRHTLKACNYRPSTEHN